MFIEINYYNDFFTYFHIYMMFKINKNNEIYEFNNVISKQNITNEIAYKLPFILICNI